MRSFAVFFATCFLMLPWINAPVAAQVPDSLLQQMRDAYQQLNYELAEQKGVEALASYDQFSNAQLVEIHTTLALVNYSQNDLETARRQFQAALALQPDLELDPIFVSPKILEFFDQVKRESQTAPVQPLNPAANIRYVQLADVQTSAALRSVVLPGWGQLYKGQRAKGVALVGLWGVAATGSVISRLQLDDARADLDEAMVNATPEDLLNRHDRLRSTHRNFLIGSVAIWLYSYLDALLVEGAEPRPTIAEGMSLSAYPDPRGASVQLSLRF